jgi:hypothetical protein
VTGKKQERIDQFVGALKRVDDEDLASLSHSPAAQALYEEVRSVSSSAEQQGSPAGRSTPAAQGGPAKKGNRRRRLIWQGALVVGAAAIVLAVLSIVNVFGAGGPSIVEKAVAALDPSANAIIHVKITGTESGAGGYQSTSVEESWASTESPFTRRDVQAFEGSPVVETVQDTTGFAQTYDAATNTIYQPPQSGVFQLSGDQSDSYRQMILDLLTSGDAVVEGNDTIDGQKVIRIAATKDYGTSADGTKYGTWYYVDPDTKNPVAWHLTRDGGKVVDFHFDVYEQLPATDSNSKLLDLAAQHPGAALNTSLEDYQKSLGMDVPAPASDADLEATKKLKQGPPQPAQ